VKYIFGFLLVFVYSQSIAQELVTSNTCAQCHRSDGVVLSVEGEDVSPVGGWMASVMAFASQDPYWRAKMAAEVADRPNMKAEIEAECLTCHAPVATAAARADGTPYSREKLEGHALGLDGVTCLSCHRIAPEALGTKAGMSGNFEWVKDETVYGPYKDPLQRPMLMHTGFIPRFGTHIESSELCAACHNLDTPIFDANDKVIGQFPEQTVYSEWLASGYAEAGETCQQCHMPGLSNDSRIALMPPFARVRNTVWNHRIVGGNTFLLSLLKYKRDAFGVSRGEFDFEKTIEDTRAFLASAVELNLDVQSGPDSVDVVVQLTNLTGHKFPTGYPERRAWLHVRVEDEQGQVVFESGAVDSLGNIRNETAVMPHRDLINSDRQVQIYEMIPANFNGERTRRLLRVYSKIKDNRLLPNGFREHGSKYSKDVRVVGEAIKDRNFNHEEGSDQVTYRFAKPLKGSLRVSCELIYQSVPPGAIEDLRRFDGQDVLQFLQIVKNAIPPMYEVVVNATEIIE
jgi:hypothetical protein